MELDVLYFESSRLLGEKLIGRLGDLKILLVTGEREFYKRLVISPPRLILIGDTGPLNPPVFLYNLRALEGFGRLPLIYYGTGDFSRILPAEGIFSREESQFNDLKLTLLRLIHRSRQKWDREKDSWPRKIRLPSPSLLNARSRVQVDRRIVDSFLTSEIGGINFTGSTFDASIEKILEKLQDLFLCDFCQLFLNNRHHTFYHLHFISRPEAEQEEEVRLLCEEVYPPPEGEEVVMTFSPEPLTRDTGDKPRIILARELPFTEGQSGFLILGARSSRAPSLSGTLSGKILKLTAEVLEAADLFYRKEVETAMMYKAFTQFLPSPIIDDLLLKQSERALMTGEKRRIVVLFSHVRHFDEMVEHNSPEKVVRFLNAHFSNMVKIITSRGGIIDKFIGDAIFAIFGAPISYMDNALRAAQAAVEMSLSYGNISLTDITLPEGGFSIGIGLNEGEAIIGNIGCSDKFDYTAIGDTINLAARLESLCKHYDQKILLSRVVKEHIAAQYYCRLIDRAKVKGKDEATEIYTLLNDGEAYTEKWRELYGRGFLMYTLGNWHLATDYFRAARNILPGDFVVSLLLERCEAFQAEPPEGWDGSVALNFK
ncbi:MAG: adenylate/guanylate cyclase domain-containing protein [Spirochaetales bacterium]|nr:adenylate/guanylate cyclase domain-containing protein [Spirochaetales bacterium]